MKAIVLQKYGTPNDLVVAELPKPTIQANEALVKLQYTSINAADLDYVVGNPLIRFSGLTRPGFPVLGSDVIGTVEAIGTGVTNLEVGDSVWADTSFPLKYGTFAEYTAVPAESLRILPAGINLEAAACLPSGGVVALQNIQLKNPPRKGQTALVNGAGGGIGHILVQLLVARGVLVTAVDKKAKHPMLKDLGVTRTIDYETSDFTQEGSTYDFVYDLIGRRPLKKVVQTVKKGGTFILLGGTVKNILRVVATGPILSRIWGRDVMLGKYRPNEQKSLVQLADLLQKGTLRPVIDRVIPLDETRAGLQALAEGHVLGKIVIKFE